MTSLTLASGRSLSIDFDTSPNVWHDEIWPWLIAVRKTGCNSLLHYLVKCVSEGWVEADSQSVDAFMGRNFQQ